MKKLQYEEVTADYKDVEGLIESFEDALHKFGLFIVEDPRFEGSDTFGFLISNREITKKELKDIEDDY